MLFLKAEINVALSVIRSCCFSLLGKSIYQLLAYRSLVRPELDNFALVVKTKASLDHELDFCPVGFMARANMLRHASRLVGNAITERMPLISACRLFPD